MQVFYIFKNKGKYSLFLKDIDGSFCLVIYSYKSLRKIYREIELRRGNIPCRIFQKFIF